MIKIIQFVETQYPFICDSYHSAIQNLHLIDKNVQTLSYTYDQLRNNQILSENNGVILFLEAGQLEPRFSGWNYKKFKSYFSDSKIVVWSSDLQYYQTNFGTMQFEDGDKIDLVFECTPYCRTWWSAIGVNSVSIPWTISKSLYKQLTELAGDYINFYRKSNDFMCLANFSSEYRRNLLTYLDRERFSSRIGGNHQDQNLEKTYNDFLDSWICIGTSSHNRPELNLPGRRTMKGYRDALAIALNCLLIYDDDLEVDKVWNIKGMPRWRFDDFSTIGEIYEYYKYHLVEYRDKLREQQMWLVGHLLDDLIYYNLKKYNIL